MTKRQRFLAISFFLTIGLAVINAVEIDFRPLAAVALSLVSAFFVYLTLRRELNGLEFFTILTPPLLLTLGFALTFYFFPNFNTLFTLIILGAYLLCFYSCLLSCNIFSAAASKNLLLLKPAQTTSLFIVLSIFFFLNTHIFKSGVFVIFQNALSLFLAGLLAFFVFWAQSLNKTLKIGQKTVRQYTFTALVTTFLAVWGLNFLPLAPFFRSLVLAASLNAVLGILIAKLMRQVKNKIIFEYFLIPALALGFSLVAG